MSRELSSILVGTSGLTLAAIAAVALTFNRGVVASEHVPRIRRVAAVAVLFQLGHFAEESSRQFPVRFPEVVGLTPWPREFFVAFNLTWLVVWVLAIVGIARLPRVGAFPLWFLAIACVANGVIHPILSLAVAGYFPGLWSSPLVGILGVGLFRSLASATSASGRAYGVT